MLTLNPITLFYYNLSQTSRARQDGATDGYDVAGWVEDVCPNSKPEKSKPKSNKITLNPSLGLAGQSQSSSALLSSRSALQTNVGVKVMQDKYDNDDQGLSDCDERYGEERDDAKNSPIKGPKVRANNNVRYLICLFGLMSTVSRVHDCCQGAPTPSQDRQPPATSSCWKQLAWTGYPLPLQVVRLL